MENKIIDFSEENIYLEFEYEGNNYAAISYSEDLEEDDDIYIVKIDISNNQKIANDIESDEEYRKIFNEYERILEECPIDEGDEIYG